MVLSDELFKLAARTRSLEASARAVRDRDSAGIQEQIDSVSAELASARFELGDEMHETFDQADAAWAGAQRSMKGAFKDLHDKADVRRRNRGVHGTERLAEEAEADAADAIDFALEALREAEFAVLDAVAARGDGNGKPID